MSQSNHRIKEDIIKSLFGEQIIDRLHNNECPICGHKINTAEFVDDLSRCEFEISGLCQKCQDEIFNN